MIEIFQNLNYSPHETEWEYFVFKDKHAYAEITEGEVDLILDRNPYFNYYRELLRDQNCVLVDPEELRAKLL